MTVLDLPAAVAIAALIVSLLVHTGALFYWGGSIKQMLRDHERRLNKLEGSC